MMKRLLVGLLVGGLLAAVLPGVAAAAAKEEVTITSPMTVNYPQANTGRFATTGTILCDEGVVVDNFIRFDGGDPAKHVYVEKTFTCDDVVGTFDIRLEAIPKVDGDAIEKLRWTVLGGTGVLAGREAVVVVGHGAQRSGRGVPGRVTRVRLPSAREPV